jgi:hypothetical protein
MLQSGPIAVFTSFLAAFFPGLLRHFMACNDGKPHPVSLRKFAPEKWQDEEKISLNITIG